MKANACIDRSRCKSGIYKLFTTPLQFFHERIVECSLDLDCCLGIWLYRIQRLQFVFSSFSEESFLLNCSCWTSNLTIWSWNHNYISFSFVPVRFFTLCNKFSSNTKLLHTTTLRIEFRVKLWWKVYYSSKFIINLNILEIVLNPLLNLTLRKDPIHSFICFTGLSQILLIIKPTIKALFWRILFQGVSLWNKFEYIQLKTHIFWSISISIMSSYFLIELVLKSGFIWSRVIQFLMVCSH